MRTDCGVALLVALLALPLGAAAGDPCATPGPYGLLALGGTGLGGDDSGIGGTGLGDDDSGIGGTGIYGTVTAFGSVCVNGLRVQYPPSVEVRKNGRETDLAALRVGQVVWVVARHVAGRLETGRIEVYSAVVGVVERIDRDAQRLVVAGREVELDGIPGGVRVGVVVDVSGLARPDGRIVASHIEILDAEPPPGSGPPPSVSELIARSEGVGQLSIEAYVAGRPERPDLAGLRLDLTLTPDIASDVRPGVRVRAVGRLLPSGALRIERPGERPPRPERREKPSPERKDRPDRIDRPERPERPDRPDISDRVIRLDTRDLR